MALTLWTACSIGIVHVIRIRAVILIVLALRIARSWTILAWRKLELLLHRLTRLWLLRLSVRPHRHSSPLRCIMHVRTGLRVSLPLLWMTLHHSWLWHGLEGLTTSIGIRHRLARVVALRCANRRIDTFLVESPTVRAARIVGVV